MGNVTKAKAPAKALLLKPVVEPVAAEAPVAAVETVAEKIVEEASVIEETQAAPIVAPVATKEAITMVDQLKTTAQTAFAQATDKGRETLEKTVKSFGEANEFAKGNVEALVASGKAASAGVETLVQSAVEFSKKNFEEGATVLKTLAAVRTPTDAFKIQNDFAKSQFDGLVAELSRSTEVVLKLFGDVFEPLSGRFALASEKVKTAVAR